MTAFKLNELFQLLNLFSLDDVRRTYLGSVDYLKKWLIQLWDTVEQLLSQYIISNSSENNNCFHRLTEKIPLLVKAEKIRAIFIEERDMSNLIDRFKSKIEHTILLLVSGIKNEEEDHGASSARNETKNIENSFFVLQKIQGFLSIISSVYSSDKAFLDEALKNKEYIIDRLKNEYKILYEATVEIYKNRSVDKTRELAGLIKKLRIFYEQGSSFINIDSDKNYIAIKNELNLSLTFSLDTAIIFFKYFIEKTPDEIEGEFLDVEHVNISMAGDNDQALIELEKLDADFVQQTVFFISKLFQEEELQEYLDQKLQSYVNKLDFAITSTIKFVDKKLFPSLLEYSFFENFNRIRNILQKIKIIEALMAEKKDSAFYSIKGQIGEYIAVLKEEAMHDISEMQTGRNHGINVDINYELFYQRISSLYEAEKHRDDLEFCGIWSDKFSFTEVVSSLNTFIETTAQVLAAVIVPTSNFYDFQIEFIHMRNYLANLFVLEQKFIKGESQIQPVIEPFDTKFEVVCEQINEKIIQNEFSGNDLLGFLDFLGVFSFIDDNNTREHFVQLSLRINEKIALLEPQFQINLINNFTIIYDLSSKEEPTEERLRTAARSIVMQLKTLHELSIVLEQRVSNKKFVNSLSSNLMTFYNDFFVLIDTLKNDWVDKPVDKETINLFVYLEELNDQAALMHETGQLCSNVWEKIIITNELQELNVIFPKILQYQTVHISLENALRAVQESNLNDLKIYAEDLNFDKFYDVYSHFDVSLERKAESILVSLFGKVTDKAEHLKREIEEFKLDNFPLNEKDFENHLLQFSRIFGLKSLVEQIDSNQNNSKIACDSIIETESSIKNKFSELCANLTKALGSQSLFYTYCLLHFSNVIKEFCEKKNLSYLCESLVEEKILAEQFNHLIQNMVEEHKDQKVEDYSKSPPKIFLDQLKQIADANKFYVSIYADIVQKIQYKVNQIIVECQKDEPPFDVRQKLNDLKDLELYLTPDVSQGYAKELLKLESEIKDRDEKSRQELNQLNKANNLAELVKKLKSKVYIKDQDEWSAVILDSINDNFDKLKQMLDSGQVVEVADILISSWNSWSIFRDELKIISEKIISEKIISEKINAFYQKNYYNNKNYVDRFAVYFDRISQIQTKMIESFSEKLIISYKFGSSIGTTVATPDLLSNIRENLLILTKVIRILGNSQRDSSDIRFHLCDSLRKINKCHEKNSLAKIIHEYVSFLINQTIFFKEKLHSGDFDSVKQILESFSKSPELTDKIFSLAETFNSHLCNYQNEYIRVDTNECFSYEKMQHYLQEKFDELFSIAAKPILHDVQAKSTNPDERLSKHQEVAKAYFSLINFKKLTLFFDNSLNIDKKINNIHEAIQRNLQALEDECLLLIIAI